MYCRIVGTSDLLWFIIYPVPDGTIINFIYLTTNMLSLTGQKNLICNFYINHLTKSGRGIQVNIYFHSPQGVEDLPKEIKIRVTIYPLNSPLLPQISQISTDLQLLFSFYVKIDWIDLILICEISVICGKYLFLNAL